MYCALSDNDRRSALTARHPHTKRTFWEATARGRRTLCAAAAASIVQGGRRWRMLCKSSSTYLDTAPTTGRTRARIIAAQFCALHSSPSRSHRLAFTMAQGQIKSLGKQKASSSRHMAKAAATTKKGHRYAAPKKAAAVKTAALHKVRAMFSSRTVKF